MKFILLICLLLVSACPEVYPQSVNPQLITRGWPAKWVAAKGLKKGELNVSHYRKTFDLAQKAPSFVIHISADTRYRLYVNGAYVGQGPANNDIQHYSYDTYDIAEQLKAGTNLLAVQVVEFGEAGAVRFHTEGTALVVQGNGDTEQVVNTPAGWKALLNEAYAARRPFVDFQVKGYYAVGTSEQIDASKYPWGWEQLAYDDEQWHVPQASWQGAIPYNYAYGHGDPHRTLSPRTIPMMNEDPEAAMKARSAIGVSLASVAGIGSAAGLIIPANTKAEVIFDQGYLTKGFPLLTVDKGSGSTISLMYTEALYIEGDAKGNRNDIEGKSFHGNQDVYLPDGGAGRAFSTLWYRTWRYVKLEVQTGAEPLVIRGLSATRFWYPFEAMATFDSGSPTHRGIWETGWRTAILCSDETYMDCPYYEQLQYIGDARIQTFISLYVSGDDRLMRNALEQFYHSITNEGITASRYPSQLRQLIPPYSLFWINMVYDYHMLRNDDAFTAKYLAGMAGVLAWFEEKIDERGVLGPLPWWGYADWVEAWSRGSAPGAEEGGSLLLSLQLVYTLQDASALFRYHGRVDEADRYEALAENIRQAVNRLGYDEGRGLYADTPAKTSFSQHTNIFAILTNTISPGGQAALFDKIVSDKSLTQCNVYFRFYLTRAAQQTGNGSHFVQNLSMWENMLAEGLTTFAEQEGNTRSDCHAWSASPNYEFLATVAGILPAAAHFDKVIIAPNPGSLSAIKASMPHPKGTIALDLQFGSGGKVQGMVNVPVDGSFVWQGKMIELKIGQNRIAL